MTGVPSAQKWEIEFTPGVWTDVTTYVRTAKPVTITYGRTSPYSDAQVGTLNGLWIKNDDGRFTPGSALLNDPVTFAATTTANPNYPNVLPRKRIRSGYTISATPYYDFYGYIQGLLPLVENGLRPYVLINAVDRGCLLSQVTVQNAAVQAMLMDSPTVLLPFTDAATAPNAWVDVVGGRTASATAYVNPSTGKSGYATYSAGPYPTLYADGQVGLSVGDTAPVPAVTLAGWVLRDVPTTAAADTSWTLEGWVTCAADSTLGYSDAELNAYETAGVTNVRLILASYATANTLRYQAIYTDSINTLSFTVGGFTQPNLPHHYMITGADNGSVLTVKLYIDGALVETKTGTTGGSTWGSGSVALSGLIDTEFATSNPGATFGPTAFYESTLSATDVGLHYAGGAGGNGYTTADRVGQYLRWAGVDTADMALDAGIQTVGRHSVAGKTVYQLCQDMATTEGGGAVFYHDPNGGKSTFLNRYYRNGSTPLITLSATGDLDGKNFTPSVDALSLVNQSTLTRNGGPNQTYTDTTSVDTYGLATDRGATVVYTNTDQATLNLAQERVASQAYPAYRVGRLTVPLVTATTSGLYPLVGALKIGDRVRVSGLLIGKSAPATQVDVFVEGWRKTLRYDAYDVVFDTTPADNPARWVWDTSRWAPVPGVALLNASITRTATTLAIKWATGPKWSTTSGSYPLVIRIDEEQIQLNGAPGGSTSPQSWTGVTRGVNNTRQAAHSADAEVFLYPDYRWQL